MSGYNPASVAAAAQYLNTAKYSPNMQDPCEPEQVTLSSTVKNALIQTDYLTGLVSSVESVLFDREYATECSQALNKDISIPTVEQNANSVLTKLYDLGMVLENIKRNLGGR